MIRKETFTVGEIFRIVNPIGTLTTSQLKDGNDLPYVASTKNNNGVKRMISADNIPADQILEGNCIVFIQRGNGAAGLTTYQPDKFYALPALTCGYIDGVLNENIALYLMAILDKNKAIYSYENPWTGDRLLNTPILLPVKVDVDGEPLAEDGNFIPDWAYINAYGEKVKLEALSAALKEIHEELSR